jgi:hypothetical protein
MALITADEWARLARVASHHIDQDEIAKFVEECEDIFIAPAIGVKLYEALTAYAQHDVVAWDESFAFSFVDGTFKMTTGEVDILLNGGYYDVDGERKRTKGLKTTLAYYTYAKVARNDGAIISRSGYVQHTDEYSQRVEDKQRTNRYNDIMSIAETYLSGCLEYIKSKVDPDIKRVRGKRTTIIAVGE